MGSPHEKKNSVNITWKKMTMKICLGSRDKVWESGICGESGSGGLGRSGEIHGILSSDI